MKTPYTLPEFSDERFQYFIKKYLVNTKQFDHSAFALILRRRIELWIDQHVFPGRTVGIKLAIEDAVNNGLTARDQDERQYTIEITCDALVEVVGEETVRFLAKGG